MRIFPYITLVCSSPLSAVEIMGRIQGSTLPLANASWHDDFRIDPNQPFQGQIWNNSFEIVRLSVLKVRHSTPPKIKGWVSTISSSGSSEIRIRYYNPVMLRLIAILSLIAASLSAASMIQDLQRIGSVNLSGLVYLVLPVCAIIAQYFQLRTEVETVQPLLARLLALKETSV
jgi:hypothetical protein